MCAWRLGYVFVVLLMGSIALSCLTLPVIWFFALAFVLACCPFICFTAVFSGLEPEQVFEMVFYFLCCPLAMLGSVGSD